jgi:hypothetical protein
MTIDDTVRLFKEMNSNEIIDIKRKYFTQLSYEDLMKSKKILGTLNQEEIRGYRQK